MSPVRPQTVNAIVALAALLAACAPDPASPTPVGAGPGAVAPDLGPEAEPDLGHGAELDLGPGTVADLAPEARDAGTVRHLGYVGCSMSNNAVEGYRRLGGTAIWEVQTSYGGGGITQWGRELSSSSRYWQAFEAAQASRPADVIWWELCTVDRDRDADEHAQAVRVYDELRRRAPAAAVYVSAQPTYTDGHVCRIAGVGGPERMKAIAEQLVAEGRGLAGPLMGPLAPAQIADGCHANAAGQTLMGQQLQSFFATP